VNIRKVRKGIQLFLAFTLVLLISAGCKGNNTTNTPDTTKPPSIPPKSTFVMDFSDFTDTSSSTMIIPLHPAYSVSLFQEFTAMYPEQNALGDHSNWTFAALNVGFWNIVGILGLAIPVASFVESVKQTPVKQPDGSWIWTYSITVSGITYTAKLQGKYTTGGIRWDMYISKQGDFTDFLWYYGESDLGGTHGYWLLKEKPSKPDDLLRIDWNRDPASETGDIKYTNISPGGLENGGYISFVVNRQEPYNRIYTIYNKGRNETTYIEWNFTTKAGRVKDAGHFNNDEWHYWDSNLKNTTVP